MKISSIFTAIALAAASLASQAGTVQLQLVGGTPQVGQSFQMQLMLDGPFDGMAAGEQLLSFGFHLGFDSSLLKFDNFTPAAGWDDDSGFLAPGIYSASTFPGLANAGQASILLATLTFDVLGSGSTNVSLVTDAGDFNQGISYLLADPVALTASQGVMLAAVPEPSAMLLMAVGVAGLLAWRRRPQV